MKSKKVLTIVLCSVLSCVLLASLFCNVNLYADWHKQNDRLYQLSQQIEERNKIIDKHLGINLVNPLSSAKNLDQVKKELEQEIEQEDGGNFFKFYKRKEALRTLSTGEISHYHESATRIFVPLYTPDGYYFGDVSYRAYGKICEGNLDHYTSQNEEEMKILHSYMNYITLNPGLSLER